MSLEYPQKKIQAILIYQEVHNKLIMQVQLNLAGVMVQEGY